MNDLGFNKHHLFMMTRLKNVMVSKDPLLIVREPLVDLSPIEVRLLYAVRTSADRCVPQSPTPSSPVALSNSSLDSPCGILSESDSERLSEILAKVKASASPEDCKVLLAEQLSASLFEAYHIALFIHMNDMGFKHHEVFVMRRLHALLYRIAN
jgi:hypothetical protein